MFYNIDLNNNFYRRHYTQQNNTLTKDTEDTKTRYPVMLFVAIKPIMLIVIRVSAILPSVVAPFKMESEINGKRIFIQRTT